MSCPNFFMGGSSLADVFCYHMPAFIQLVSVKYVNSKIGSIVMWFFIHLKSIIGHRRCLMKSKIFEFFIEWLLGHPVYLNNFSVLKLNCLPVICLQKIVQCFLVNCLGILDFSIIRIFTRSQLKWKSERFLPTEWRIWLYFLWNKTKITWVQIVAVHIFLN